MDEIKRMLNEEIKTRINDLSGMPTGSSERKETVDEIAKLCGLVNGDDKREQRIDRFIKYALEVIGIGLPRHSGTSYISSNRPEGKKAQTERVVKNTASSFFVDFAGCFMERKQRALSDSRLKTGNAV